MPGRRFSYREGATYALLTFGSVAAVSLISSILTSRIYGVDVIGEYTLAAGALSALRLLSTAKERPALVRALTEVEPRHHIVTGLFLATLAFSAALTCVVAVVVLLVVRVLLTGPIAEPTLFLPLAVNVASYALIGNTAENIEVVASAFRAGRQLFWVRVVDQLVFIAVAIPLGFRYGTVWGLIIASVASQLTGLIHRAVRIRRYMRFSAPRHILREGFETLPGLIRFGLKIAPGALADGASNESGTWLVATFSSISAVGAYGRAYLLIKQLMVVNLHTNEMLFPTLVERRAKGDGTGYSRALVDSLRYTTVGMLFMLASAGGVAEGIMRVFGPGFAQGGQALVILLLVPPLSAASQIQRFALYSLERPWLGSIAGFIRFGVTIVAGVILTWKLGAVGAALSLVIGFVADITFCTRIVVQHLETPFMKLWPMRQWIALLAACASGFAVGRIIYTVLSYPAGLFAGAVAGGCLFVALLFAGVLNERDRERFGDLRRQLGRRLGRARLAADGSPIDA